MAFQWTFEEGFEAGTRGNFDAETDTDSILDFPHYSELARWNMAPYRGAYCMRIKPAGGTASAYVQENASFDLAADATAYLRKYFYLGRDFTMADTNKFSMFEAESVADTTTEIAYGLDRSGANIRFWVSETSATAAQTKELGTLAAAGDSRSCLGRWFAVELAVNIDAGGGNDGTIDAYINGTQVGSQITALDQGAIVDAKFGVIGLDAGTTGTILMDEIRLDEARVYPYKERFPTIFQITKSEHIFVGPGNIANAAVLSAAGSDVLRLWDTDIGNIDDTQGFKAELDAGGGIAASFTGPLFFQRGCYAQLSGTNPRAQVTLITNSDTPGVRGPVYYSERGMISYGLLRKPKSYGI